MKVLIVCSSNNHHISPFVKEQADSLEKLGVEIEYYLIKGKGIKGYLGNIKNYRKALFQSNPDLVHAHYGLSGLLANFQLNYPVITTFHNGETLSFLPNVLSSVANLLSKYSIYVGEHIYNKLVFKKGRKHVIKCGIDLEDILTKEKSKHDARKTLNWSEDKTYIVFGGAFDNLRKNYALLKNAIEELDKSISKNIQVVELVNLNKEQVYNYLYACDVFALPSLSEGSPQALKEAMGCNRPIIATNVGDVEELFGNLEGHFMTSFDPLDVAKKLSLAIEFSKNKGTTQGREQIVRLKLYNSQVAQEIKNVYQGLIH